MKRIIIIIIIIIIMNKLQETTVFHGHQKNWLPLWNKGQKSDGRRFILFIGCCRWFFLEVN